MNEYQGEERRKTSRDHDTLIEMVQILKNHVANFDTLNESFKTHQIKDETNFDQLRKDGLATQRIIWMATGVIMAVQAIPAVMKVLHIINK